MESSGAVMDIQDAEELEVILNVHNVTKIIFSQLRVRCTVSCVPVIPFWGKVFKEVSW